MRANHGSHTVHMGAHPSPRHSLSNRSLLRCSWEACNSVQQSSYHPSVPLGYQELAQDNKKQSLSDSAVVWRKWCMRKPHHASTSCTEESPSNFSECRSASAHATLQHTFDAWQLHLCAFSEMHCSWKGHGSSPGRSTPNTAIAKAHSSHHTTL